MTISKTQSIASLTLIVMLVLGATHAVAGPRPPTSLEPVVTVKFADLNTSSPQGTRVLYDRITAAAQDVCSRGGFWYPSEHWAFQECFQATRDRVVAKLNLPSLTALHVAITHRTVPAPALQAGNR